MKLANFSPRFKSIFSTRTKGKIKFSLYSILKIPRFHYSINSAVSEVRKFVLQTYLLYETNSGKLSIILNKLSASGLFVMLRASLVLFHMFHVWFVLIYNGFLRELCARICKSDEIESFWNILYSVIEYSRRLSQVNLKT